MIDPIAAGLIALVGAIAFAQGFTDARARWQKHNFGESENRTTE